MLILAAGTPTILLAAPAAPDSTGSAAPPDSTRPPSPPVPEPGPAYVVVETRPSGLRVTIGAFEAGWSPIAAVRVASGRVTVRAFPRDSRRFDPAVNGVTLTAAVGETLRVLLDVRPHPLLRSKPTAAVALLGVHDSERDSIVGETPLRLAPAILEAHRLRFEATGCADSVVAGAWLLQTAEAGTGSVALTLRSLNLPPPPRPPGPSLLGRRWFRWSLIGAGAVLTGGAVILRNEGDRAYERYLQASDPRVIEREYDRTTHYDRWSVATLGTGQVLFTTGLFLLVSGLGQ